MQLMTESHQLLCVQPFNMAIIKVYVPTTEVEQKVCGRVYMSFMVKFNLRLTEYESKICCLLLGTGIQNWKYQGEKIHFGCIDSATETKPNDSLSISANPIANTDFKMQMLSI